MNDNCERIKKGKMILMNKKELSDFYQNEIYGFWREGEEVTYELLGPDPKASPDYKPASPFEVIGGELVRIRVKADGREGSFIVHAFIPKNTSSGHPFIVCMHPIMPKDYALERGYAIFFMESIQVATDNTERKGAFYDVHPYGPEHESQTGVLMAWAWGASKVLDAVYAGLDKEFNLDPKAAMVTGVSRWGKATAVCGAFDKRFRMTIPACSGAGGLALNNYVSEGKTYDFSAIGGPAEYTYTKNEPLSCLQSDAERGWFNDRFLKYASPADIPVEQNGLVELAMADDRYYFIIAACTGEDWVNAPAMWECYKLADKAYEAAGLADHLVVNFHREGHAVLEEDMMLIIEYFNHMYYGNEYNGDLAELKTSVFKGQE